MAQTPLFEQYVKQKFDKKYSMKATGLQWPVGFRTSKNSSFSRCRFYFWIRLNRDWWHIVSTSQPRRHIINRGIELAQLGIKDLPRFLLFHSRERVLELDMFLDNPSHNWTLYTDTHLQAVFFFIVYWSPRPPKTKFIFIQQDSSDLHVRVKTMTFNKLNHTSSHQLGTRDHASERIANSLYYTAVQTQGESKNPPWFWN